jgi:hypothetical protein
MSDERRAEILTEGEPETTAEPIYLLADRALLPDVVTAVQDLQRRMGVVQNVEVIEQPLPHD